jgi:hypothetical protein
MYGVQCSSVRREEGNGKEIEKGKGKEYLYSKTSR